MYLWLAIFTAQRHKEERFMYVAFPLISLNAAISIVVGCELITLIVTKIKSIRSWSMVAGRVVRWIVIVVFMTGSVLRIFSMYQFYHAPIKVYSQLVYHQPLIETFVKTGELEHVCVGKEWYRFPSHFFVPTGMRVSFIPSRFRGLLPFYFGDGRIPVVNGSDGNGVGSWKEYERWVQSLPRNYTSRPEHINNMNQHEEDRYVIQF
jgi:alpha-1,2-mannosyltransferase